MTFEEASEFLEKHEDEFLADEKGMMEGFNILAKYGDPARIISGADHDIVRLTSHDEKMSEEEILKLHRLGFHLDNDVECWAMFC